jgi:hypothetical protein
MFGWLRPSSPLDAEAKRWVESHLAWLADEFGGDVFTRRAIVLPTEEFFPAAFDGSESAVQEMYEQVCGYMDVDPTEIPLEIYVERRPIGLINERGQQLAEGAGGRYHGDRITLNRDEIVTPMRLVAVLAHELSHHKLMGGERIDPDRYDNELLTDLTAIFHGFGIFLANSVYTWQSMNSYWPGTSLIRPEYMTEPMMCYALAHRAWLREEPRPEWMKHLAWGTRACFKHSLRYLRTTKDSTFRRKVR